MNRSLKVIISVAILASALILVAARSTKAGDEWLPVSPEDLALKDNPKSPGANAMILYRESTIDSSHIYTDGVSVYEYVRIKIFTKEGVKEGNVEIPVLQKSFIPTGWETSWEEFSVKDVSGRTIRQDGSTAKFDGRTYEKTLFKTGSGNYVAETFSLPDVQPGCIIEYKYRKQYQPGWIIGESWILSSSLFTREAHFAMKPYTGAASGSFNVIYRYSHLQAPVRLEEKTGTFAGQDYTSYSLVVHDVPGIEEEPLMPPKASLEQQIAFFYRHADEPKNESPEQYWSWFAKKWYGDFDHFVGKKNVLSAEVSKILSPGDAPETKLRKIYTRVQQIRNRNMEDYKTAQEQKQENLKSNSNVEDVLDHGYANGREINYLFAGLARAAGFEATEVYLAPRNRDVFQPQTEDSSQLSADIVSVKAGTQQEFYLDPGSRYYPFGLLPWYETGSQGMRLSKQGATIVTTPMPKSSDALLGRHADLQIDADGTVSGKLQIDFSGQHGALLRVENRKEDEVGRKKALEEEIHRWLPTGSTFEITKIENWDNVELPVHVEGTVKIPGLATPAGKRMLVPVTIFQSQDAKAFQSENRTNNVQFPFPYQETDDVTFRAPAGYKLESIPPAIPATPAVITYEIAATQQGDSVEVKRHLDEQGIGFEVKYYPALRAFFNVVKSNDEAQIIFQSGDSAKKN